MKRSFIQKNLLSTATHAGQEAYSTDFARFDKAAIAPSTGSAAVGGAYNVFVSARGELLGSYSVTSKQDSYRAINASFSSKTTRR